MNMKVKNITIYMCLIAIFMCVDGFAIYSYGIGANFTVFEAVLAAVLIAALLNIPPFFIASYGFAIMMDDTFEERQRYTAKIISLIGIIYLLLIVGILVIMRIVQIRTNLADPYYNNLLMDAIFTVSPVLTTIFAIVLGIRAVEPNIVTLRREWEETEKDYRLAREKYDALYNDLRGRFETLGQSIGCPNFFEAVINESEDVSRYIDALERAVYPNILDTIKWQFKRLYDALHEKATEARLTLDAFGPGPDIIAAHAPSEEFNEKALLLLKVDMGFEDMVNELIRKNANVLTLAAREEIDDE